MRNKNWSKEEDEILKNNYEKIPPNHLTNLLPGRNYNAIKGRQTFLKICRQYTKDNSFFKVPNILNSSIAGFTASDGHISPKKLKRKPRIFWGINTKDKGLLEQINFHLKSNYTITNSVKEVTFKSKTKKPYKYIDYKSVLCLSTADELSKDLFDNWNIPSGAKSLILGPPNITNLDICLSYIKGIIIGDGTILATDLNGTDYCKISILGTEKLLSWIKSMFEIFLKKEMDEVSVRPERSGAKIFILCITGLKASRIIDKLNQLNTLQLDRKFKRPEILNIIKSDKEKNPDLF